MKSIVVYIFLFLGVSVYAQELDYSEHEPHEENEGIYFSIHSIGDYGDSSIIAGGKEGYVLLYENAVWSSISIPNSKGIIREITGDEHGNIYAAVDHEGLWVMKNGVWIHYNHENSTYPDEPQHGGMAWDKETQILWVGTQEGLVKLEEENLSIINFETYGFQMIDDEIVDLVLDDGVGVWMISKASTLMHFDGTDIIFSQAVGWDLEIYDLVFMQIDKLINGNIVLSTLDHGLMIFDHNSYLFIQDFDKQALYMDVDEDDQLWAASEFVLWKFDFENLESFVDPFVPELFNDVFVSNNNHVWLAGHNGPIIEILQDDQLSSSPLLDKNEEQTNKSLYPNPVKAGDKIKLNSKAHYDFKEIIVFNIWGQQLQKTKSIEELSTDLGRGIYIVLFRTGNDQFYIELLVD